MTLAMFCGDIKLILNEEKMSLALMFCGDIKLILKKRKLPWQCFAAIEN